MADANIIVKIVDQTRGGLGNVVAQTDKVGKSAGRANTAFVGMGKAIAAAAAAVSVDAFLRFGDSVQNIQNRLALINPELGNAADNFQNVLDIANRTYQPLDAVAGLYQKVANSAEQYGLTTGQVNTVTETFTNLLRLAGADAGTAAGAITQFAQALGSGTLRGDELNSVIEATAGEILPLLAEELGVTRGQVRELAADGQITGDILLNALGGSADEVGNKVGQMSVTIGGAITVMKNNFTALGTEATPVFNGIAQAILLLAENLDTAVTFVVSFVAAFSVAKMAAIVTSLGGVRAAVLALNVAIAANPIGLIATAIALAATAIITNFDSIKESFVGIWDAAQRAYLNFENFFLKGVESIINDVVNGFQNMGTRVVGFFTAIGKAALDPLNAMTVFREEMEKAEQQVAQNTNKAVDFSDAIAENDRQIQELTRDTKTNTGAIDKNTTSTEDNTDATGQAIKTTDEWTDVTDQNTDAIEDNNDALSAQERFLKASVEVQQKANAAVESSINALRNETYQLGLEEDARDDLVGIIKLENAKRKELGDDMEDMTQEEIAQLAELTDERDFAHAGFMALTAEEIDAYYEAADAHRAKVDEIKRNLEDKRAAEREAQEFTRDTERAIQRHYEETTSKQQQLTDDLNDYIRRAREAGRINDAEVQEAIRAKRYDINQQIKADHQDLMEAQERQLNDFRSEYSAIYDDMYGVLEDWTGKSKSELDRYNQYSKLLFGVDILGAVTGFADNALMSIGGFSNGATQQMGNFAGQTMGYMDATGNFIASNTFGPNGAAAGGIAGFVGYALQALGGGNGLFGVVTALFGGLGLNLQNIFSTVFSSIGNGLSSVGGFLGDALSGIGSFGSSVFSGIGDFFGDIFGGGGFFGDIFGGIKSFGSSLFDGISGFFGDIFGGFFEDGGYIKPGTVGIVGEAGAEFVSGPANVMSARDTAGVLGGSQGVNINFNIQAVDAKGIDQLLIDRKTLIADVVRDAVSSSGRRI